MSTYFFAVGYLSILDDVLLYMWHAAENIRKNVTEMYNLNCWTHRDAYFSLIGRSQSYE